MLPAGIVPFYSALAHALPSKQIELLSSYCCSYYCTDLPPAAIHAVPLGVQHLQLLPVGLQKVVSMEACAEPERGWLAFIRHLA